MWLCRSSIVPYLQNLRRSTNTPWILSSISYYSGASNKKPKLAPLQERSMVDRYRIRAKGGDGGSGCFSYRRSRHERKGTPDGGNGGTGGDVILECSPTVWDFRNLQHHLNAKRGGHGVSKNKIGSRGADKVVYVPVGTVLHLVEGELPSVAERCSSKPLDPWEVPGTLVVDPSESDERSTINVHSTTDVLDGKDFDGPSSHTEREKNGPAAIHKASLTSSLRSQGQSSSVQKVQSKVHIEESLSCSKESESEDLENDTNISQEEVGEEDESDEEEEEEEEEEEIRYNVAELTEPGQRVIVARGGEGGLGSTCLGHASYWKRNNGGSHEDTASTLENQDESSPSVGSPGSEAILVLELKSIADVGLVGMPNAGKSTLLGSISRAKPTVGHYAFTTLRPSIGNLNYDDFFSVTVADIPGLIKGAHENRGLGHAFLRHIERTKVLAYVVDLAAALDGRKGIPPWEQLRDLIIELEYHQEGLSNRPSLIVANKIDEEGTEDVYEELKVRVQGAPIFPVCAVLEEGVTELKAGLRALVDSGEPQKIELDGVALN